MGDVCSLTRKNKRGRCLNNDELTKLAKKIKNPPQKITKKNARVLLDKAYPTCKRRESCYVDYLNEFEIKKNAFAPFMPDSWKKNPVEWLSSDEITCYMKDLQRANKKFVFIGPSPHDFYANEGNDCVWPELCRFQLAKSKPKIGVIFNLDNHTQSGSHWVAMFISKKNKSIFYFDSTGEAIPAGIAKFRDKVLKQSNNTYTFYENHPVEHQQGDTECGMYVLNFILDMAQGPGSVKYFNAHFKNNRAIISDDAMQHSRSEMFSS
jgi:hypothetical protein